MSWSTSWESDTVFVVPVSAIVGVAGSVIDKLFIKGPLNNDEQKSDTKKSETEFKGVRTKNELVEKVIVVFVRDRSTFHQGLLPRTPLLLVILYQSNDGKWVKASTQVLFMLKI